MEPGSITGYIDGAQVALYVFWLFFAGLVFYLRREDRREGYPLESDPTGAIKPADSILFARPKIFRLPGGGTYQAPNGKRDTRPIAARRAAPWPGAPLVPTGNPLVDGVGPAAWAERTNVTDKTWDGHDKIVPTRVDGHYAPDPRDPDPRGMNVFGADERIAGTVTDIWVDRSEHMIRYLEVALPDALGNRLVPMTLSRFVTKGVKVKSIMAAQFADAPMIASPDAVTRLEEDKVAAYFTGGHLYATRMRSEPLI